jgi:hypothetical protein
LEVDLRVDLNREPVGELRRIFEAFKPLLPYYRQRPRDPSMRGARRWLKARGMAYPDG